MYTAPHCSPSSTSRHGDASAPSGSVGVAWRCGDLGRLVRPSGYFRARSTFGVADADRLGMSQCACVRVCVSLRVNIYLGKRRDAGRCGRHLDEALSVGGWAWGSRPCGGEPGRAEEGACTQGQSRGACTAVGGHRRGEERGAVCGGKGAAAGRRKGCPLCCCGEGTMRTCTM